MSREHLLFLLKPRAEALDVPKSTIKNKPLPEDDPKQRQPDISLANKEREVPEYLQLDEKNKKVKFVRIPKFEEVPYPVFMEPNLVI